MRLLVIDGNSLVNRAFFGIKLLTTREGQYTNAIFGFLNMLLSLLKQTAPDEVAVAFDRREPTFRHTMYEGYKANRHGMPEELASQLPVLKQLLRDLGYKLVDCAGWEADDILGTLAGACEARGDTCFLATGDRDSLQLISPLTTVLLASTVMGKSQTQVMDEAAIRERYGVSPRQMIEVKSLMGDTSDCIPGVKGIGEKTALALVQRFGSLDGVYEQLADPFIKPKQRENLTACREEAYLSRTLGTIRRDAPVETAPGSYGVGRPRSAAVKETLLSLEMNSLLARLELPEEESAAPAAEGKLPELPRVTPSPWPKAPSGRYLLALQPEKKEKQGTKTVVTAPAFWYAVQEDRVYIPDESQLAALLDDPAVTLPVFDSAPLYALALEQGGSGASICWDGKLAAYLLDPASSHYEPESLAGSYGASAAFLCEELPTAGRLASLAELLKQAIREQGMQELYDTIEFPLARVLADMTHTGILVDRQGLTDFGRVIEERLEAVRSRIYETVGSEFNLNSPKQLGEVLFETLGLPHGKRTKTGWATDAATLEELRAEAPVVDLILEYRTYQKLSSTYVEGLLRAIGEDGRIHGRFKQTEARTGRLSSDEPNLQNIPIRTELGSRLRAFFTARPGWVLLDADYSQIELRILAHISGDKAMQRAFLAGEDIHRATAATIYGISPIEVTPAQRSSAKTVNFGIMYGKQAFSLARDLGISVKEAGDFLAGYLAAFPSISRYMDRTIQQARKNGYTTTLFGRRRALPELKSSNFNIRSSGERMARNTPIQGTAADIIKLAMVRVWNRLREEKLESRLILTVHDELILEAPEAEADRAGRLLQEEMQHCVQYAVPLTTELGRGSSWLEAH